MILCSWEVLQLVQHGVHYIKSIWLKGALKAWHNPVMLVHLHVRNSPARYWGCPLHRQTGLELWQVWLLRCELCASPLSSDS